MLIKSSELWLQHTASFISHRSEGTISNQEEFWGVKTATLTPFLSWLLRNNFLVCLQVSLTLWRRHQHDHRQREQTDPAAGREKSRHDGGELSVLVSPMFTARLVQVQMMDGAERWALIYPNMPQKQEVAAMSNGATVEILTLQTDALCTVGLSCPYMFRPRVFSFIRRDALVHWQYLSEMFAHTHNTGFARRKCLSSTQLYKKFQPRNYI